MKDTKTKILDAALDLFSKKGYDGTNLQEIADKAGLVKSGLYRHFSSKEDLWECLIDFLIKHYNEGMVHNQIPNNCKQLEKMSLHMIDFTMHDEKIIKIRKILHMEQFRNKRTSDLATMYLNTKMQETFENIFAQMIKNGSLKNYDGKMMAMEFVSPIAMLINLNDRDPSSEKQINKEIKDFIKHFLNVYGEDYEK